MQGRSEVKAGLVIVVAMILSTISLMTAGKFRELLKAKQTLNVYFTDVQGLKVDDPVQLMGYELGKVYSVEATKIRDEAGQEVPIIEVVAKVVYSEPLPVDTKITIDRSLTGNTVLKIEPGRSPVKLAQGQKIVGIGAVSMTELANKAGIMAKRLDDFLADLTDRNMSQAIRAAMFNLKQVSEGAKIVAHALSENIPDTAKSFSNSIRNLETISHSVDQVLAKNKEAISNSIQNVSSATGSLSRATNSLDGILEQNRDLIHSSFKHVEKATSNMKALSREVRWQPWVLLNKPDEVEIRERSVYNSALEFSEGAESLNNSVKQLVTVVNSKDNSAGDAEKVQALMKQIHENLEKSTALERKLWTILTEKAKNPK